MGVIKRHLADFIDDEAGAGTAFALGWAIICLAIGGLAVDSSNVWAVRQHLQSTADIAAHSGIMRLVHPDRFNQNTTIAGMAVASTLVNMPVAKFGTVLVARDVEVGEWSQATRTMDLTGSADAVRVTTRMDGNGSKIVPTFILKIIGFDYWRVSASAVFQRMTPSCVLDGMMAGGKVDLTSNNHFSNDICMHGYQGVELNSNNTFDPGVTISMPDTRIERDGGDFDPKGNGNIGMWDALSSSALVPELASNANVTALFAALSDPTHTIQKPYITDMSVNTIRLNVHNTFDMSQLSPNAVNIVRCGRGAAAKVDIPPGVTVSEVVVIADCPINLGRGSAVENAILMTTDTSSNSLKGANGVRLGIDDDCQLGGGGQFITFGGINFASSMEYYGSQVIARGDVQLAAAVEGIEGISLQTGGDISITSNNIMGLCGGGVDMVQVQNSYRMVN